MPNGDSPPRGFLPLSRMKRRVAGLRDYEKPTECRVYKANPDGTVGTLLKIEPPIEYREPRLNHNGRNRK